MTIKQTLEERGSNYGAFKDNARLTQEMLDVLKTSPNWNNIDSHFKEAFHMILHKIARVTSGKIDHIDSYVDIIGYTQLLINIINSK